MKCPQCGKGIRADAKVCKHCKTRLIRKSDRMARKMTVHPAIAMASGGILVGVGVVLAIYDSFILGGVTAGIGAVLMVIGRATK